MRFSIGQQKFFSDILWTAMSLQPGEQLGPYEIIAPLGRGGMGEVYRARDTRLRREVAVKMLSDAAANDEESLQRFLRETHVVAALNHPNIVAIHDSGMHRGVPYAVTELLEGETLAERLRSGPLASKRATEVASQLADALAAAHASGVIHRDVKPENVFLTREGRAKILDFGIARVEDPRLKASHRSGRSTSSLFLVGTAGYVSPEQVRGGRADGRSDVFALGAVFYEMLTGRRAFARDSAIETLSAVLSDRPEKYPETEKIPTGLRPFLFRCLQKDPTDRYQSARDLLLDLRAYQAEEISDSAGRVKFRSVPPWQQRRTRLALRALAGLLLFLVGLYAGSCWERGRHASSAQTTASDRAATQ
jgi:serine/threonine protein kinase